ncbi:B- and T-lymphocyte attenuator-like [Boleophthalmus pectinirostris]|uniref:B- and T-lymphocyte attenuator-like n=1 Tax=Boleophthalmus pectinirostris TaxID=150288 RepID=UPI00243065A6|nr:B- and T-lymphocyte attenuator-like [Boleophthalmus pectinirostris]
MEVKITEHMLVSLFSFIIISCGGSRGSLGCDVEVQVRRGQVYAVSPHEYVEIKCPVQHCGKPVHVVWCKVLDTECSNFNTSNHIQIKEGMLSDDKMESVLIFKKITVEDSGEYSCRESKYQIVGHMINVNVSEMNQGGQNHDKNPDRPRNCENDQSILNGYEMKITALVFVIIFLSIVLLLFTITAIVLLRMYACKSIA